MNTYTWLIPWKPQDDVKVRWEKRVAYSPVVFLPSVINAVKRDIIIKKAQLILVVSTFPFFLSAWTTGFVQLCKNVASCLLYLSWWLVSPVLMFWLSMKKENLESLAVRKCSRIQHTWKGPEVKVHRGLNIYYLWPYLSSLWIESWLCFEIWFLSLCSSSLLRKMYW